MSTTGRTSATTGEPTPEATHVGELMTRRQLTIATARLLDTDVGVATSGVAGPEPMEGQPVGTLWVGVSVRGHVVARSHKLDGDPAEIRVQAVRRAPELTAEAIEGVGARS